MPLTLRFIVDINVDDNHCDNGKIKEGAVISTTPEFGMGPSMDIIMDESALASIKICQNYGGKFGDLNTQVNPVNSITLPKTNKDVNP